MCGIFAYCNFLVEKVSILVLSTSFSRSTTLRCLYHHRAVLIFESCGVLPARASHSAWRRVAVIVPIPAVFVCIPQATSNAFYPRFLQDRKTICSILCNGLSRLEYRGYDSAGSYLSSPPQSLRVRLQAHLRRLHHRYSNSFSTWIPEAD